MLLSVESLRKEFSVGLLGRKRVTAVDDLSFELDEGRTLGLVGPSGCGKSSAARCVLRLLRPDGGKITFRGEDITYLPARKLRHLGREMALVAQSPQESIDPLFTASRAIEQPLILHAKDLNAHERHMKVHELMEMVGLGHDLGSRHPHQLSGGQLQRVAIARALALGPSLIVADESTSMLDVLVQAQILRLLKSIQEETGVSYLFISHDRAVVDFMSHDVVEMDAPDGR